MLYGIFGDGRGGARAGGKKVNDARWEAGCSEGLEDEVLGLRRVFGGFENDSVAAD